MHDEATGHESCGSALPSSPSFRVRALSHPRPFACFMSDSCALISPCMTLLGTGTRNWHAMFYIPGPPHVGRILDPTPSVDLELNPSFAYFGLVRCVTTTTSAKSQCCLRTAATGKERGAACDCQLVTLMYVSNHNHEVGSPSNSEGRKPVRQGTARKSLTPGEISTTCIRMILSINTQHFPLLRQGNSLVILPSLLREPE